MSGYQGSSQPQAPKRRHRVRNALLIGFGAFCLLIIIVALASSGTSKPAATSAPPVTAQPAATASQPATQSAKPAATKPAGPVMVGRFSGTGNYNSPPFTLNGNPVTVVYSYSGNIMAGETIGDGFMADVAASGDDQQIANAIAVSGGTTTTLYPDTAMGGASYHLSVQATGSWSFTITEAP